MTTTDAEIAWAAGLFEGEGCISLSSPAGKAGGSLILRTTDPDVLHRFMAVVGAGRIRGPLPVYRSHHKPAYEWRVGRWDEVVRVLAGFLPWLGERRTAKARQLLAQPVAGKQGQRLPRTACKRGHPLVGADADVRVAVIRGYETKICRACYRARNAERRAA